MSNPAIVESIYVKARDKKRVILFPDAEDIRVLRAAEILHNESIAIPILIGDTDKIEQLADSQKINYLPEIKNPNNSELSEQFSEQYYELSKTKGITPNESREIMRLPLYWAGMALRVGYAAGCVAGSLSATGDVLRAGIRTVGLANGIRTVSSWFLIIMENRLMAYADCGVLPYPTEEQLSDIAYSTSLNYTKVTGEEPRVAFLSFSTHGSANHESVKKVQNAYSIFSKKYPYIIADGELQADAALIPAIAQRKAPDSPISGDANILIFPNLDAGNIAYKLTERLAGAIAIGPLVQGLAKPYCDLSRGCSVQDIVTVAAITALMADMNS